jgi:hypothetical protein
MDGSSGLAESSDAEAPSGSAAGLWAIDGRRLVIHESVVAERPSHLTANMHSRPIADLDAQRLMRVPRAAVAG